MAYIPAAVTDTRYVFAAGDQMTGPLVLSADPAASLDAATKQYADTKVAKTGDTMTGTLAVPKVSTATAQLVLEQTGDAYGATRLRILNRYGSSGAQFENDGLDLVDFLFKPSTAPTSMVRFEGRSSQVHASNQTYGEFQLMVNGVAQGTSQFSVGTGTAVFKVPALLPADPTQPLEAATKQYVDGKAGLDQATADLRYVNVNGGDTMTGNLVNQGLNVGMIWNSTRYGLQAGSNMADTGPALLLGSGSSNSAHLIAGAGTGNTIYLRPDASKSDQSVDVRIASDGQIYMPATAVDSTAMTPSSGVTLSSNQLRKKAGWVHLTFGGSKSTAPTTGTILATVPAGYRPGAELWFAAVSSGSTGKAMVFSVDGTGQVKIRGATMSTAGEAIYGSITYPQEA